MQARQAGVVVVILVLGTLGLRGEGVPPEAMKSAAAATKVLGDQVLRLNYSYVFQKMHPRFKARAAKKAGGEDQLAAQLAQLPDQMKKDGIVILSFEVGEPESGFLIKEFNEWVVFVPTTKVYLVPDQQLGVNRRFESKGYQVAVSKVGANDWYFIDGANMAPSSLRSIFPSLPPELAKLNLPPVSQKEIK